MTYLDDSTKAFIVCVCLHAYVVCMCTYLNWESVHATDFSDSDLWYKQPLQSKSFCVSLPSTLFPLVPALLLIMVYLSFIHHDAQSGLFCPHAKEDNLAVIADNKLSTGFCKASGK